jgi:hypothetical protein
MNKDLLKNITISAIITLGVKAFIEKILIKGVLSNILIFFISLIIFILIEYEKSYNVHWK